MHTNYRRALLSLVLSVVLVLQTVSLAVAQGRSFVFTALTADDAPVPPVCVPYEAGQSVADALMAAGIVLARENGVLRSVNGVRGNFTIGMDGGEYDLDVPAETVTAVCVSERTDGAQALLPLLREMGAYLLAENHVENYAPAREAYANALRSLRSADETAAAALTAALSDAMRQYDAILGGERYPVTVTATADGVPAQDVHLSFTDIYGNETVSDTPQAMLCAGTYTYCVTDGAYGCVRGEVTVTGETALSVALPTGEWFGRVTLTDEAGEAYPVGQDDAAHTLTVLVPDTAGERDVYLRASQGADLPDAKQTRLYALYTGTDGKVYDDTLRSWNSGTVQLTALLQPGMQTRTFTLAARNVRGDTTAEQTYTVRVLRTPTLSSLTVTANGVRLPLSFDPLQTTYTLATAAEELDVAAQGFGESYTIDGCGTVAADGAHAVTVTADGQTRTYTLRVERRAWARVTVALAADAAYTVYNAAQQPIPPTDGAFALTEGERYEVDAVYGGRYHTVFPFTANDGLTVQAPAFDTTDALLSLALYSASSPRTRIAYELQPAFTPQTDALSVTAEDAASALYAQATAADGWTVTAQYLRQTAMADTNGTPFSREIASPVSDTESAVLLTACLTRGGGTQCVTFRAAREEDGVRYYCDCTVRIIRSLHLSALSATAGERTLTLRDEAGQPTTFFRRQTAYSIEADASCEMITLHGAFTPSAQRGYYALVDGVRTADLSDVAVMLTGDTQTVRIEVLRNADDVPATYTLHVRRVAPVYLRVYTTPADASVCLTRGDTGDRVWPTERGYALSPGETYICTVTANGYVGRRMEWVAPDADAEQTVVLTPAPEPSLSVGDASWNAGRDAYNNGVTDAPTPIAAEDAVLRWAVKLGEGTGSGACGCPIVANGFLYTYAGSKVYRIDPVSGAILAEGEMDHRSGFAINTPTYAEGMLFVALSDGAVQAFRADTLESLWIYRSTRGGQPNCPIAYCDGYIYTGFWIDEDADADFVALSVTDEDPSEPAEEKLPRWIYTHTGGFYWAGAYASESFVLVGTDDGAFGSSAGHARLLSLDPRSGALLDALTLPHTGDVRSAVTFVPGESGGTAYFTVRSGWFDAAEVTSAGTFGTLRTLHLQNGSPDSTPITTSTPTVYGGRAYIGVSGASQFTADSGHNVTVIDLHAWAIAYTVPTHGFPQSSGLLTTAYAEADGDVYVYFFENYLPGTLRMLCDRPGQTSPRMLSGGDTYALFTPHGAHAQYALCTPVADADGTLFGKNDSGYLFAIGSTVTSLDVTAAPTRLAYDEGEAFDPAGMAVTATFANGVTRDVTAYVTWPQRPLTADDAYLRIEFPFSLYHNAGEESGKAVPPAFTAVSLTVTPTVFLQGDADGDGTLTAADAQAVYAHLAGVNLLSDGALRRADHTGDGVVDVLDARAILDALCM